MKPYLCLLPPLFAVASAIPETNAVVKITSGIASFDCTTNVPGIGVKGKSNALTGAVKIVRNADGLILKEVTAAVPVSTLATGMKVRDQHMRKLVFTGPNGEEPDLQFQADVASCPQRSGGEFSCSLTGNLQIHGVSKPFAVALRIKEQADGERFKVDGEGLVKLSDYGITPPTQFGVSLENEVKLHLELTAKGSNAQ